MHKYLVSAFAALALLAGCNSPDQSDRTPQQQAQPAAAAQPVGNVINGTVTLRDPMQIGAGARLDIKLVDVVQPQIPIAEKTDTVNGQPPFNFTLEFDPSKVDSTRTYVVNVTLTDGDRHFVPALNSPVLTGGAGATAQIVLNAEATPSEKMDAEFNRIQAHIGGMRKIEGTYTTDTASIGWDAFIKDGKIAFMRVNTVEDKGGRSSVKYAFKDDKPMELAYKAGGITERVGWDETGQIVVNKKSDGTQVGDEDAKALYDEAVAALKRAQEKAGGSKK
ncbi:MAG TPA: YbaY family lipoprotein [Rhodanobacteraceae bacterium]|nr:YbaY family lipoprotein [Rhodanobacteraceae bacterium]